ncbi:MAG: glycosyltransferase family 2 protein [Candidatus Diapherotrites archaeon]
MAAQKLAVIIPAFNEEKTIAEVVQAVPRKIEGISSVKIIVVDDGSVDKTIQKARNAGADFIELHETNKGLGVAFRTGIEKAIESGADIIVNIDADGQFNAQDIPKLISPILNNQAEVVTCSRFKEKALAPKMPWIKRFGNNLFTWLVNYLTGERFTDTQCGFRAYTREAALRLTLFGKFTYTQEALLDLVYKGFRVKEVALEVKGERSTGKSRVVEHWYSYGVKALLIMVRAVRDHHPLRFFGGIGFVFLLAGGISALVLLVRLLVKHVITPYTWVAYADIVLIVVGFLLIVLALIADMWDRQRKIQEEILYRLKKGN